MKNILFILVLIYITSCSDRGIKLPDQITVEKTKKHKKFPLSSVYIITPDDYVEQPSFPRFQKNQYTYIQVLELPGISFKDKSAEMKEAINKLKSQGMIPYYEKDFLLNGYTACFFWVPNSSHDDQMVLFFGDEDFIVLTMALVPINDKIAREEIFQSLCSLYYAKQESQIITQVENFSLDLSATDFKFHSRISQISYYTINGTGDPMNNPEENHIIISSSHAIPTYQDMENYSFNMLERYKSTGMSISNIKNAPTSVNASKAYEIIFDIMYNGVSGKVYQLVVSNDKLSVLFVGITYDNEKADDVIKISKTLMLSNK